MSTEPGSEMELLVVDRFEGGVAVLAAEDESVVAVDRGVLPAGAREGVVVRVPRDGAGGFVWGDAVVDEAATAERASEAESILRQLRDRDPGGDVVL